MRKSIKTLSYGLTHPRQLLEKLQFDAEKLGHSPHPNDVFNFVVTAAVLAEWAEKFYQPDKAVDSFCLLNRENNRRWHLPRASAEWISDTSCLPNLKTV